MLKETETGSVQLHSTAATAAPGSWPATDSSRAPAATAVPCPVTQLPQSDTTRGSDFYRMFRWF